MSTPLRSRPPLTPIATILFLSACSGPPTTLGTAGASGDENTGDTDGSKSHEP